MKFVSPVILFLIFLVPWLFELYTFHLYIIKVPEFFIYSGARLPFFIVSVIVLGYLAGRNICKADRFYFYALGCGIATLSLVMVLYQFCEVRECYYIGSDGFGEARLFLLLFSASTVGLICGSWPNFSSYGRYNGINTTIVITRASIHSLVASIVVALFVGIYPASLLYDVPSEPMFRVALFVYYVTVPFLLAGFVASQLFDKSQKWAVVISLFSQAILFYLFEVLTFNANENRLGVFWQTVQLVLAVGGSVVSAIAGSRIGHSYHHHYHLWPDWQKNNNTIFMLTLKKFGRIIEKPFMLLSVLIFLGFAIFAIHPLLVAPMDLLPDNEKVGHVGNNYLRILSAIPSPMYYSGVVDNEPYFPTKRVEVNINFTSLHQRYNINESRDGNKDDVLLAGIGAQSPNCCKDGLDYGYRADILFTKDHQYLVARAWETCDQNAACSGFPFRSIMHESALPIDNISGSSLAIAMEWAEDGRTVNWYYHTVGTERWIRYSSFKSPTIENAYFNLGVASINNFLITSLSRNVNFFQAGIATLHEQPSPFTDGKIIFECPAFYKDGIKHCFSNMTATSAGDSDWKFLWGWGKDRTATSIHIDNAKTVIEMLL